MQFTIRSLPANTSIETIAGIFNSEINQWLVVTPTTDGGECIHRICDTADEALSCAKALIENWEATQSWEAQIAAA